MTVHGHAKSELRNLHLHRRVFEKLRLRPELREPCVALLETWLASPSHAPARSWLEEWRHMLAEWSLDEIAAVVLDRERGQTLLQCSPLAPVLTPMERWTVLAEINREIEAA